MAIFRVVVDKPRFRHPRPIKRFFTIEAESIRLAIKKLDKLFPWGGTEFMIWPALVKQ